jgi:molybdenum cofactor cytidylyltransferase
MVRAIVLAAGDSTRMGSPKALLPDGSGRLFITRILHTFAAAGLTDVTIVTGALHARIVEAIAADVPRRTLVRFARNPDPSRGQLSSMLTGLDAADAPDVHAVLVTLADVPFVRPATVRLVLEKFQDTRATIVRPVRGEQHGHPVLFARTLFCELRSADPAIGAKGVVRAHAAEILNLDVDDQGALLDVDTRDEYERVLDPGFLMRNS